MKISTLERSSLRALCAFHVLAHKITIPSDRGFVRRAFRAFDENPCESSIADALRPQRAEPFRAPATTLKFHTCAVSSCEAPTLHEPNDPAPTSRDRTRLLPTEPGDTSTEIFYVN